MMWRWDLVTVSKQNLIRTRFLGSRLSSGGSWDDPNLYLYSFKPALPQYCFLSGMNPTWNYWNVHRKAIWQQISQNPHLFKNSYRDGPPPPCFWLWKKMKNLFDLIANSVYLVMATRKKVLLKVIILGDSGWAYFYVLSIYILYIKLMQIKLFQKSLEIIAFLHCRSLKLRRIVDCDERWVNFSVRMWKFINAFDVRATLGTRPRNSPSWLGSKQMVAKTPKMTSLKCNQLDFFLSRMV
jgi:hypothetical protein